jgi:hypothetical protein
MNADCKQQNGTDTATANAFVNCNGNYMNGRLATPNLNLGAVNKSSCSAVAVAVSVSFLFSNPRSSAFTL